MTVYFAKAAGMVKIGYADDVERRMLTLSASFSDGIELVAQCDGGKEVEAAFHNMFADSRGEGEWFSNSPLLEATMRKLEHNVTGRRFFGGQPKPQMSTDAELAKKLMEGLFDAGVWSISKNLESSYIKLAARNPEWSRRRVRAIWNGEARSISFREVSDLAFASNVTPLGLAEMIVAASGKQPAEAAA